MGKVSDLSILNSPWKEVFTITLLLDLNWKKITVANIVTDLIRKIFNLGEAHSGRYKVLKILIFAWKLKFDPWKQMLSVVLSEESHIVHAQGIVHAQENVCQTSMSE